MRTCVGIIAGTNCFSQDSLCWFSSGEKNSSDGDLSGVGSILLLCIRMLGRENLWKISNDTPLI